MPQNRRDCEITLQHPSYIKLYEILKQYEEPHLRDIFLQQVAYNCAIRKFAIDIKGDEESLWIKYKNLAEYGLSTYSHVKVISDHDASVQVFDIDQLILDFPIFDGIKSRINETINTVNKLVREKNSIRNSNLLCRKEITLMRMTYVDYSRYPIVQQIMMPQEKEKLLELLQTDDHEEAFVLPLRYQRNMSLPNHLSEGSDHILLNALYVVRAFFYFDAKYFYKYTQSMVERSLNFPSEHNNVYGHNIRYVKRYLNVITPYIQEKRYFDLIKSIV